MLSLGDSLSSSGEDNVEIHTENTSVGIILDSEIDVFFDTESEVTYKIKSIINFYYSNKKQKKKNTSKIKKQVPNST